MILNITFSYNTVNVVNKMKQSKYSVFLKVVETGSLSRAAEECNYSQPAVSQILTSLEKELGLTLLHRSHAGVHLTSEGEQLLPFLREVSRSQLALAEKADELLGVESGLLRIGTFSSISCHLLAPALKTFHAMHPHINFELFQGDYHQIENWIQDGTVDFGFVDLPTRKEFYTLPLLKDRMVAILPPTHPYAQKETIPLELFAKEPMILLEEGTRKEVITQFKQENITPQIAYRTEDDYTVMSLVENGLGISILGELVLNKMTYNIVIKETSPAFSRQIGVAARSRSHASNAVKAFLKYLENTYN